MREAMGAHPTASRSSWVRMAGWGAPRVQGMRLAMRSPKRVSAAHTYAPRGSTGTAMARAYSRARVATSRSVMAGKERRRCGRMRGVALSMVVDVPRLSDDAPLSGAGSQRRVGVVHRTPDGGFM